MADSEALINSPQCLEMINLIVENYNKDGLDKKPHVTIELAMGDIATYVHMLLHHRVMCFFMDCFPLLLDLKHWTVDGLEKERKWPMNNLKFVG